MKIFKASSKEGAMRKALVELNACLKDVRKNPVLLMLSSGSALELLDGITMRNIGKHITVTVLDERFSTDPAVNNFSQIAETEFYKQAEKKGIDYIDTRVHNSKITLQKFAKKFERGLRKWRNKYPKKGKIIITGGVGQDGHTAGIMPYPENHRKFQKLFDSEHSWVVGYHASSKKTPYRKRVTVTLPFLRNQPNYSFMYAVGQRKKAAIRRMLAKKGELAQTPARIIHEMHESKLFCDL